MRYHRFARLLANGEWEHFRCPEIFSVHDVARHSAHSVVCQFIPNGWRISIYGHVNRFVEGPCWAVFDKEKSEFATYWLNLEHVSLKEAYQYS